MQTAQQQPAQRATVNLYAARFDTHADAPDAAVGARLNYIAAALAEAERRARLFRTPREELEARLMRRPVTTERAFALFGLLLGTLPPAAIFGRFLIGARTSNQAMVFLAFMLPMLAICALLGRFMAKRLGRRFDEAERGSWLRTMLVALGCAFVWAAATGTAGGLPVFLVGGVFGFACALPCALIAFSVFVPLHRSLARGGMIDARHLHPLAWGINLSLAALILSPHVIPY
ncbi:MAG: hypothetical protein M3268_03225 [Acidobacteriota bacterium]|nr:hypothetical protein [Acidobacteriota bacterium]